MTFIAQTYTDIGAAMTALEARIAAELGGSAAGWQAPTLQNGWVNYGGGVYADAGYCKVGPVVYLRGLIKNGTVSANAFVLPAGYRPSNTVVCLPASNGAFGRLDVRADGSVNIQPPSGNAWLSLDNIAFLAA